MSVDHDKNRRLDLGLLEVSACAASDAPDSMRGLHLASESVLRLAMQTHAAVARGDAAGASAARVVLQAQLAVTTGLIEAMLLDETPGTRH
ncbi:hypothetical protein [Paraburkholderia sp. BCC1886]|uniref:hypothetical protein n=1 Tax=Paraburkholderia sp. BCC1886 TaxID=2562670 RepID=UPI00118202BC|nr:hypothetical protein [Paraburkholderia sp. BCC1886]